jgi:hypothetical protein
VPMPIGSYDFRVHAFAPFVDTNTAVSSKGYCSYSVLLTSTVAHAPLMSGSAAYSGSIPLTF